MDSNMRHLLLVLCTLASLISKAQAFPMDTLRVSYVGIGQTPNGLHLSVKGQQQVDSLTVTMKATVGGPMDVAGNITQHTDSTYTFGSSTIAARNVYVKPALWNQSDVVYLIGQNYTTRGMVVMPFIPLRSTNVGLSDTTVSGTSVTIVPGYKFWNLTATSNVTVTLPTVANTSSTFNGQATTFDFVLKVAQTTSSITVTVQPNPGDTGKTIDTGSTYTFTGGGSISALLAREIYASGGQWWVH